MSISETWHVHTGAVERRAATGREDDLGGGVVAGRGRWSPARLGRVGGVVAVFGRVTLLVGCLLLPLLARAELTPIPDALRASIPAPKLESRAWILIDHSSGWVLAEHNADERLEPASLSKLMTAYVVFGAVTEGKFKLTDTAYVSEKAWRTGGSRMFIQVDTRVSIEELLKGLIVQSGNDAAVALAEHVAGSEEGFAELMNQAAARLGLKNSHFVNSTGLPDPEHYSSARDLAALARALIAEFPELYKFYSIKEFTYNDITQRNRNRLLWRDESVDGVKTGHTNSAGYCLIGSSIREGMRLVAVVLGSESAKYRTTAVHSLLQHGHAAYEAPLVYGETDPAAAVEVFKGDRETVPVGVGRDLRVTVPRGTSAKIEAEVQLNDVRLAPVARSTELGTLRLSYDGTSLGEYPLVALEAVAEGPWWGQIIDQVRLWLR